MRLNVASLDEIAGAIQSIREIVKTHRSDATIDGFIVAEMVTDRLETLVGVVPNSAFNPAVAFGLGGVATEVLKKMCYRGAPFGAEQARAMIGELRSATLFGAFRGCGELDVDTLADAVARMCGCSRCKNNGSWNSTSIRCSCVRQWRGGRGRAHRCRTLVYLR